MSGKKQNAVALLSTLAVTAVTKKIVDQVWRIGSGGKEAPTDPADPDIDLRQAMVWAVISGAAISVARTVLARRLARHERREARVKAAVGG
jgi:hypothetical protein